MASTSVGLVLIAFSTASAALIVLAAINREALSHAWWRWRHPHPVPVTIMVANPAERRHLERAIGAALRQLTDGQTAACPASAIVVQRLIWDGWGGDGGRQIHGCAQRPARFAADPRPRLCLALEVDGRALPVDEMLATLAELWSLHAKGDDREFIPVVFSPARRLQRSSGSTAPTAHGHRQREPDD